MAKWRNKKMSLELKGFDEFIEKLHEAGKDTERVLDYTFNKAALTMKAELQKKATEAGLSPRLVRQITERSEKDADAGHFYYQVGWAKQKASKGTPLPDTYKVMFYNYGTPSIRRTKEGGQRIQIDGKWVTLGTNRGKENAHPNGSHGFIKKAKIAAANKNRKFFREALKDILGDLK